MAGRNIIMAYIPSKYRTVLSIYTKKKINK
jgi:hypothetical protein